MLISGKKRKKKGGLYPCYTNAWIDANLWEYTLVLQFLFKAQHLLKVISDVC